MNQIDYEEKRMSETLLNYHEDVILNEVSQLYNFAERSLMTYQNELYDYLFPVFMETSVLLLKKNMRAIDKTLKFFNTYYTYHYAFHGEIIDDFRRILERMNPQQDLNTLSKYYKMTVTMRKSTRHMLFNYIVESKLYYIQELENFYINFDLVDDSTNEDEIIRTRLCYYIQLQNNRNSYNYIEGFAKHVKPDNMKDSINRTFPSIAVASFSNRFDSHIICIKISKDGKNFACSTENGLVHLWHEIENHRISHHLLLGHSEIVTTMDFSNDGKYLLTGSLDGSVKLWLTDKARCLVNYRTFSYPVWHVCFCQKNAAFCVCYYNALVQLFNTKDIQEVYHYSYSYGDVTAVAWSIYSKCFFLGYNNGNIICIAVEARNPHRVLLGNSSPVSALLCLTCSTYIAVGCENGNLIIYDLMNSEQVASIKAHDKPIRKILYNINTDSITTLSEDGFVKFWELKKVEEKTKEEDLPELISFHETENLQRKKNDDLYSLFLLRSFSMKGMEFLDGVYMKDDIMVVAGVSNSSK